MSISTENNSNPYDPYDPYVIRCMALGYYYCSLDKGHTGPHLAHFSHDLTTKPLQVWWDDECIRFSPEELKSSLDKILERST